MRLPLSWTISYKRRGLADYWHHSLSETNGELIYLILTRPNISYGVGVISQFIHAPMTRHLDIAYHILRYLQKNPGQGLLYGWRQDFHIEAFTNVDWARFITDRRSTFGYCTFMESNLVTWHNKKQPIVARSSAKAKFWAMAHGIYEMLWSSGLLRELWFHSQVPLWL